MPKNYIECVKAIRKKQHGKDVPYNPFAVCSESTGYFGTTHDIGLIHKKKPKK